MSAQYVETGQRAGKTADIFRRALEVVRADAGYTVLVVVGDSIPVVLLAERLVMMHGARMHELRRIVFVRPSDPLRRIRNLRPSAVLFDCEPAERADFDATLLERLGTLAQRAVMQRPEDM